MVIQEIKLDKSQVIESFKDLPDKVTADDLIERILFLKEIEKSLLQVEEGKVIPHSKVKEQAAKWLKK
ncbi:MAG: hypothetical protein MUD08_06715 [Cytophagales bacterium]|jgi:hypothetical protein|nr:hypothetical protein [Cytophagales bacterium]